MPGELTTENPPPVASEESSNKEEEEEKKEPAPAPAPKPPVVGIIYPPPEVRNIVDKTADFVARNGPEFEGKIRINEAGNTKFNFLNPHDPYHAYYQHKVKEVREGVESEASLGPAPSQQQKGLVLKQAPVVAEPEVPRDPPPVWEFMADPPSISSVELDIVKLTAQFVARNGAQFLDKLIMREQRNYQFDFLRKQHPLFNYFAKLVEQYSKVFLPAHETIYRLRDDVEDPLAMLERVNKRVHWEQYQARMRRKVEEELERERVQYAQIDWHDFVIVETINFRENEAGYLPPPIKSTQLAQRLLQQQKYETLQESGDVQEIEMEVEEPGEESAAVAPPLAPPTSSTQKKQQDAPTTPGAQNQNQMPPGHPPPSRREEAMMEMDKEPETGPGGVQIRKDYNPKLTRAVPQSQGSGQQYLISPITGEKIPAEKMEEHMRYGLLDPRWVEEKKRASGEGRKEDVFAEGTQIGRNLGYLAERRTDIFGAEETVIGMKIGEEAEPKKQNPILQWDGHAASVESVQRAAQAKAVLDEHREAMNRAQGIIPQKEKEKIGPALPLPTPDPKPALPPSQPPPMPPPPGPGPGPSGGQIPPNNPLRAPFPPPSSGPQPLFPTPPSLHQQRPPQGGLIHGMGGGPMGLMQQQHGMPPRPGGMIPPQHQMPGVVPMSHHVPLMGVGMGGLGGGGPGGHPHGLVDIAPPVAKRQRTETDDLIPEQDYIAKHPGPVTFKVLVPHVSERPEWRLNGQTLTVTLPITDQVSVIKAKICDELGMPAGKQKLQIGTIFIKDSNTLGFYNCSDSTLVLLAMKERGGRKK